MPLPTVDIHYRRLSGRLEVFRQIVLEDAGEYVVTFLERATVRKPVTDSAGRVILEPGAPVVWFTYRGAWHDVGRFHRADGTFTGLYANVLTPVAMDGARWDTTDLCLDLWRGADGRVEILDEDELREAVALAQVDNDTAERARAEARTLAEGARADRWPPVHVHHWTLERAREILSRAAGGETHGT